MAPSSRLLVSKPHDASTEPRGEAEGDEEHRGAIAVSDPRVERQPRELKPFAGFVDPTDVGLHPREDARGEKRVIAPAATEAESRARDDRVRRPDESDLVQKVDLARDVGAVARDPSHLPPRLRHDATRATNRALDGARHVSEIGGRHGYKRSTAP